MKTEEKEMVSRAVSRIRRDLGIIGRAVTNEVRSKAKAGVGRGVTVAATTLDEFSRSAAEMAKSLRDKEGPPPVP